MSDVNMHNELNKLYMAYIKSKTDFWMMGASYFTSLPEESKPPIIEDLHALAVNDFMNNAYVIANKDILNAGFAFTQKTLPFFNTLFNTQINPVTWSGMPAHNLDSFYQEVFDVFIALQTRVFNLLTEEGFFPQP